MTLGLIPSRAYPTGEKYTELVPDGCPPQRKVQCFLAGHPQLPLQH